MCPQWLSRTSGQTELLYARQTSSGTYEYVPGQGFGTGPSYRWLSNGRSITELAGEGNSESYSSSTTVITSYLSDGLITIQTISDIDGDTESLATAKTTTSDRLWQDDYAAGHGRIAAARSSSLPPAGPNLGSSSNYHYSSNLTLTIDPSLFPPATDAGGASGSSSSYQHNGDPSQYASGSGTSTHPDGSGSSTSGGSTGPTLAQQYQNMQSGVSRWDASDTGFDLTGTVSEASDFSVWRDEQLAQSSEDLMRMNAGRNVGAVQFQAASREQVTHSGSTALSITHGVGRQFGIDQATHELTTNNNWVDKQISSRSEYREYAAATAAPATSMTALRTASPNPSQSLLGDAPAGSSLLASSAHTTFYFSPLSDVTKTVRHWIEPYVTDGSPNAAPILYRYLEQVSVNVTAWVTKTGQDFNGSTTLRSRSTFRESNHGTLETQQRLERQDPSSQNNWTETFVPVQSHTGGITQSITHSKPAADNTITIPGQGTHTTVAPGGEYHTGTSTLATYLTVQQQLAEFVGSFTTKTGFVSNSVTSPGTGASSDAGGQDTGPMTGGEPDSEIDSRISSTTAEIEALMREGLANANRLSLEQLKSLATGTYHSVYDPELGMFAIKPTEGDRWYLFESYTAPTGQAAAPTHSPVYTPVQMGVYWRLRGWEPGNQNPDLVKEGYQLRHDLAFWNGAKDAGEFTLHLVPGGSFVDKVAGESDDSWGYVLFVSVGDCLMVAGCFVKAGTRGARIVNGLSIGENLTGAGLAGYQGLGENGSYSHGGDFLLRLVAVGLGARNLQLEQKLGELGELGARRVAISSYDVVNSASLRRLNIPNRIVQDTVEDYVARNLKMFEDSGGTIIRNAGPAPTKFIDGVAYRTLGNMNYQTKTIRLYDGHEIQDLVEELAHFRQSVRDGFWGTSKPLGSTRDIWESQIDTLFENLGFVPR